MFQYSLIRLLLFFPTLFGVTDRPSSCSEMGSSRFMIDLPDASINRRDSEEKTVGLQGSEHRQEDRHNIQPDLLDRNLEHVPKSSGNPTKIGYITIGYLTHTDPNNL